jgi:hypothetical protein
MDLVSFSMRWNIFCWSVRLHYITDIDNEP